MEVAGTRIIKAKGGQSRNEQLYCELCQEEDVKINAVGVCKECEEYMCDTCFRHHLKAKLCRNHVLVDIGERPTDMLQAKDVDVEKCKKHDNEVIKFYCRTHDTVGCGDCIIFEHKNCKPEYIKDMAKTYETEKNFKEMIEKLAMLESIKGKSEDLLTKNQREIYDLNEKALERIQQFRSDINNYLDKAEADVRLGMKELTTENFEQHKMLEQDMKLLVKQVEEVKKELNPGRASDTVSFILAVTCKPKIERIERKYEQIRHKNTLKKFEFVRSEKLAEFLKSSLSFGQLFIRSDLKTSDFVVGAHVQRGPDWNWENQDDGGAGTVTGYRADGWAIVKWDTGTENAYRIGQENAYDLIII